MFTPMVFGALGPLVGNDVGGGRIVSHDDVRTKGTPRSLLDDFPPFGALAMAFALFPPFDDLATTSTIPFVAFPLLHGASSTSSAIFPPLLIL